MKPSNFASSILILTMFTLVACNNTNREDTNQIQSKPFDTSSNNLNRNDSTATNGPLSPSDTGLTLGLLRVGIFHHDEVEEFSDKPKWAGLFKNNGNYYLKLTEIETVRVHDPVLDDKNKKTGWRVTTMINDSSLILIEQHSFLANRTLKAVKLPKKHIYPGDSLTFKYLNTHYKLFATGDVKQMTQHREWNNISNYKLYLQAVIQDKERKSLLVAQPNFDDQMITLVFAGDIDGDGIMDLIIDTSRHYNVTSLTLYLSRPADKHEIVKEVGTHTSVGG